MQIFLPIIVETNNPYSEISTILDNKRCFKQVVEAKQVINNIETNSTGGWSHHPIIIMWKPYINSLKQYYNTLLQAVKNKGVSTTMESYNIIEEIIHPWFIYYQPLIYSHRRMLKIKDPVFYKDLTFPPEYLEYGYIWIRRDKNFYINTTDLSLIADKLNNIYINPKYCTALVKNKSCGTILKNKKLYCGIHKNQLIKDINKCSLSELKIASNIDSDDIEYQKSFLISEYKKLGFY
jgi:hypothetical protein